MAYTFSAMQTDEPGGRWGASSADCSALGMNPPSVLKHLNRVNPQSASVDDRFPPVGKGIWSRVPDADWNDWRWQLRNRITTLEALEALMPLMPEEREGVALAGQHLAMAITPYFFNLIDINDPNCPIRRQVIPRAEEMVAAPWEVADPCGEDEHRPVPGLVHRYPDRELCLVTDRCAAYCR